MYMADVMAFRLVRGSIGCAGRFQACSVTISSIGPHPSSVSELRCESGFGGGSRRLCSVITLGHVFLCFRNGTARTQAIDFSRAESQLPKNLVVVFSDLRGALRGNL